MLWTPSTTLSAEAQYWELQLVDPDPPVSHTMGLTGFAAGDIDGDGYVEFVTCGDGALLWYRPVTLERGLIAEGRFHVGLVLEDIDGDGKLEVVAGELDGKLRILWFKAGDRLSKPWRSFVLDPACGGSHDLLFADIDGDGKNELVAGNIKSLTVDIYRHQGAPTKPWTRHTVLSGYKREGTAARDVNGDGVMEIVSGPDILTAPPGGPYRGSWIRRCFAPSHREMCRAGFARISEGAAPDIILGESEYVDGRLSWFEGRRDDAGVLSWAEHRIDNGLYFAHSLHVFENDRPGCVKMLVAEMAEGGWHSPRNPDSTVRHYLTADGGVSWEKRILARATGSHEAEMCDVDGDGALEVVGKEWKRPQVQILKQRQECPALQRFQHKFVDLDKPYTSIELAVCDVTGNGRNDIVCGAWWYRNPDWRRFEIPGIEQVIYAHDIDGDGNAEIIGIERTKPLQTPPYDRLSERLVWLKKLDPEAGKWETHPVGTGGGDWPHGALIAPILPGNRLALVITHHGAWDSPQYPELFEIPEDPASSPWPKRTLAKLMYSEEIASGILSHGNANDLVLGSHLLQNRGDGTFAIQKVAEGFGAARTSVADIDGNGSLNIILGEQVLEREHELVKPVSRLAWFRRPAVGSSTPWEMHVIDHQLRCVHSMSIEDLDHDGIPEIVVGEHDPSRAYRNRCRLLVYKKANPEATSWYRHVLDDRFEHHCGAKAFEIEPGRFAIASHGWTDSRYVHLWEAY